MTAIGLILFGVILLLWSLLVRRLFPSTPLKQDQSAYALKVRILRASAPILLFTGVVISALGVWLVASR